MHASTSADFRRDVQAWRQCLAQEWANLQDLPELSRSSSNIAMARRSPFHAALSALTVIDTLAVLSG